MLYIPKSQSQKCISVEETWHSSVQKNGAHPSIVVTSYNVRPPCHSEHVLLLEFFMLQNPKLSKPEVLKTLGTHPSRLVELIHGDKWSPFGPDM